MSDADRASLAYHEEATFKEAPSPGASGPRANYRKVRFTGENLGQDNSTVRSAEIRSDRQTTDVIRTNVSASGNIDFEFSGLDSSDDGVFDDLIIAAILAAEDSDATDFRAGTATDRSSGGNISFNTDGASPGEIADRDAGGVWTDANVPAGSWIRVVGSDTNDGVYKVISTPDDDTISVVPATLTQDIDDTGVTVEVLPAVINGTNLRTYAWEREYEDLSTTFSRILGTAIDQWNLNATTESIITGSFVFVGSTEESASSTLDGSKVDAPDTQVFNPVDHVTDVLENQADFGITSWTMSLANNLRSRLQVGTLGAISLGSGQVAISGTVQSYFETVAHYDRFLNHTTTSLALVFKDDGGTGYVIDLPAVKLSAGRRVASGQNTDIIADMSYEAFRATTNEPTGGVTIRVAKIPA